MIVIELMCGIGNQLFQYAFGRALALHNNTELKLDNFTWYNKFKGREDIVAPRNYALNYFKIKENFASLNEVNRFRKSYNGVSNRRLHLFSANFFGFKKTFFLEPGFNFCPDVFKLSGNVYFEGFWQSEKYFLNIKDNIYEEFNLKDEYSIDDLEITDLIKDSNAISIHVRRKDYVNIQRVNQYHGVCSVEYYQRAISHILKEVKKPHFFFFSDDIDWVKENFNINNQSTFVSNNSLKACQELRLMSYCKHNIIANSSFSWWGAWLNKNPEKIVIAPEIWFSDVTMNRQTEDLIPSEWLII